MYTCSFQLMRIHSIKTFSFTGKAPVIDIQISGGWSVRRRRHPQLAIDQIFHFSVFACLIILASYIFIVHKLLYYETLDSTNLKHRVEYLLKLNEQLNNVVESVKQDLEEVKLQLRQLAESDHVRERRSVNQNKDCRTRKRNRCNRTKTIGKHFY